jgi:hypothetical protein
MDEDTTERIALWIVGLIILLILVVFGVGIWAIVEIVQWLTSK